MVEILLRHSGPILSGRIEILISETLVYMDNQCRIKGSSVDTIIRIGRVVLLAMMALSAVQSSTRTFFTVLFCSYTPPTMHKTSHLIR